MSNQLLAVSGQLLNRKERREGAKNTENNYLKTMVDVGSADKIPLQRDLVRRAEKQVRKAEK